MKIARATTATLAVLLTGTLCSCSTHDASELAPAPTSTWSTPAAEEPSAQIDQEYRAPAQVFDGDCEAVGGTPDGQWSGPDPTLAPSKPWLITIPTLGGLVCQWQGDFAALVFMIPHELRPDTELDDFVDCGELGYCFVSATLGAAWMTAEIVSSGALDDEPSLQARVEQFLDSLGEAPALPRREYPVSYGSTVCDEPRKVVQLEAELGFDIEYAVSESQYGGYAPPVTSVALRTAVHCNLQWTDDGAAQLARAVLIRDGAWAYDDLGHGEAITVPQADHSRRVALSGEPRAAIVARAGDDLVIVEYPMGADDHVGVTFAAAVLDNRK